MEWVIAVLSIGCLFFIFQIAFGYLRHKSVVTSRLKRLEESRNNLEHRIQQAKEELDRSRGDLEPAKEAVETLEQEYQSLQDQIKLERANSRRDSPSGSGRDLNEEK
ncbi:MAG: hypothetical protein VX294_04925 [Candidatus Latescibacterota bacterium]|nr:hypothetical protein [Candidatus Latescibacterota bacterium]